MASDEVRKKWGTIFMGEREASVEQLNAMQAHVNREKLEKEQTEDYMERVRARAADRAREILGAAYTERQKVLEEAKGEAAAQKRLAAQECVKIKAEGEELRRQAQQELDKARAEREEAEQIRANAHEEGLQAGMDQAGRELHEFRADMGHSVASLLRAIERQRRNILDAWRADLVELTQAAVQAGTGLVLQKEHQAVLRNMVFQALDLLEKRSVVSLRVNPADEESVSDLFHAARERAPELKQWVVTGDESLEPGSVVAESGTGSVDLRRGNFREMVDNILDHLWLTDQSGEAEHEQEVARLVEQEVAHIASMTPEIDTGEPVQEEAPDEPFTDAAEEPQVAEPESEEQESVEDAVMDEPPAQPQPVSADLADIEDDFMAEHVDEQEPEAEDAQPANPSLEELEDELFPLDGETAGPGASAESSEASDKETETQLDSRTLAEGGFL